MSIPECGYLYIACGEKYIKEVNISAMSLRRVDKDAHITLITDKPIKNDTFDNIKVHPADFTSWEEGLAYRTKYIYNGSPYNRTFFVDTDSYFYDGCSMLFEILDYFDILMSLPPADTHCAHIDGKPLAGCTPYNSGVMIYKKNSKNETLFKNWSKIYEEKLKSKNLRGESDQTSFMEALLSSEARVYVLPYMFNARIHSFLTLTGLVKIVHERCSDYEKLRAKINANPTHRGWDPMRRDCIIQRNRLSVLKRIKKIPQKSLRSLKKFARHNLTGRL